MAMTTPRSEFVLGQILAGSRYRLVKEIGQGGMGTVFEVEHVELGKRFVLKAVLHRAGGLELVKRLREEWKALGRIDHPNIVSVTDAGATKAGVPFYVMERLQGEDLQGRLRRERRLSLRDTVRIGCEVLDALDAAHQIGVVHRDVKPSNVFLPRQGPSKLLDFGVAKLMDSEVALTRRGAAVGTPRYMSPEQACGEQVDSRSDLYAVGLLLFEMLAGQSPFEGASDREIFEAHLHRMPPPLSEFCPDAPEELTRLVARLLEKEPAARPSRAGSALALLRAMRVTFGSIPPGEPKGSLDRFSTETLDAVRGLLARSSERPPIDTDAPTVPADDRTPPASDTPTEVIHSTRDEAETRTHLTGTRTPPAVSAAKGRKPPKPSSWAPPPWVSPARMLLAGLVGGGATVGLVLVLVPPGETTAPEPARGEEAAARAAAVQQGTTVEERQLSRAEVMPRPSDGTPAPPLPSTLAQLGRPGPKKALPRNPPGKWPAAETLEQKAGGGAPLSPAADPAPSGMSKPRRMPRSGI
jgi:eukaryotic-like serine/threonine-protein kinase